MGRVVFGIFPMGPIVTGFDTFANGKGVVSEVLMFTGDVRGGFMVPAAVRGYLEGRGYLSGHLDAMDGHIAAWDAWMSSTGEFYDYRDTDGFGRTYSVHRRSIRPAMRVCQEWASLLLNDKTTITCDSANCTKWLRTFFTKNGFLARAQEAVVRSFGLGTGAWAVWCDLDAESIRVRFYDARMVVPLTWEDGVVTECAFVTRAYYRGQPVDQLQMHLMDPLGYSIETVCFDKDGNEVECEGVRRVFYTFSDKPTFAIIRPAVENTRVDMSPYGQSVFADAVDAIQAVDLCFDAMVNEVDVSKMRVFLSDVMFEAGTDGKRGIAIPFGKGDCTVFRKVMSTEDTIQEFAPALRTESQMRAFKTSLQMLGDLCGLGIDYFDFDSTGYVRTATEVSADNSALMRNIRRHENALQGPIVQICRAVLECARRLGANLPREGEIRVGFDDSIITDTTAEKRQDMDEFDRGLMQAWEYRCKWYGEDEQTARERSSGSMGAAG